MNYSNIDFKDEIIAYLEKIVDGNNIIHNFTNISFQNLNNFNNKNETNKSKFLPTTRIEYTDENHDIDIKSNNKDDIMITSNSESDSLFSILGPGKFVGSILDHPDKVWTEDQWDESRIFQAKERIEEQGNNVSDFWRGKYENEASMYWHEFYKRNQANFYKDRHYLHVVFPDLDYSKNNNENKIKYLLEVGCGVGNAIIPLMRTNPLLHVHAFDCAKSAVDILKKQKNEENHDVPDLNERLSCEVCNIVVESPHVETASMDFVLCMFVLSAISPIQHQAVFSRLTSTLKKGGKLLLRDYGLYDEAQLRFKKGSKICDNFYVRCDGTCSYFFSEEDISRLSRTCGLKIIECNYILRQYANREQKKARYRVWIHAIMEKI